MSKLLRLCEDCVTTKLSYLFLFALNK